jgi:hypothetical protein
LTNIKKKAPVTTKRPARPGVSLGESCAVAKKISATIETFLALAAHTIWAAATDPTQLLF